MASAEEPQEHAAEWRAGQKERERERRRMRDRQRRQSMSAEEREKHLARRRRNYQLRRQRAAANAPPMSSSLGFQQTNHHVSMGNASSEVESDIQPDNLAMVSLPEFTVQSNCGTLEDGFGGAYEKHASSVFKLDGETTSLSDVPYKYPRIMRLNQIKQLARLLNSPADKSGTATDIGALVINEETVNSHYCVNQRNMRLIHVKNLARALHSNVGKTIDQQN